jgi:hypothetical protein
VVEKTIKLIVAEANGPPGFFSSIKAAESYLEWIDVENGEFPFAYDPDGNVYRFRHENRRVTIERDGNRCDPEGLNALLQKTIASFYMPVKSSDNAFLLSLCSKYIDY